MNGDALVKPMRKFWAWTDNPGFKGLLALAFVALFYPACSTLKGKAVSASAPTASNHIEYFRLGWYDSIENPDSIADITAAGFDYSMPYVGAGNESSILAYIEVAERHNLDVYLEIPRALVKELGADLADYARKYADSEAVLGWYLYDEPEWKLDIGPARLEKVYTVLKDIVPQKPVAIVFMFTALVSPYRRAMDALWFDFYPIADGQKEFSAFGGGRYARIVSRIAAKAASLKKPLTLVLQGFGADVSGKAQFGRRLPTPAETRYMLYAALLGRPSSLVYWTYYRSDPDWVATTLAPLVREFRQYFPRGITYETTAGIEISGGKSESLVLRNDRGHSWLLIVSHEKSSRRFSITLPAAYRFASGQPENTEIELSPFGTTLLALVPTFTPSP